MKLVAIHQPNFFPWLGYFHKIAQADLFILLDDVAFEKSSRGSWVNRVRLAHGDQPYWFTLPVARTFQGSRTIAEMRIDNSQKWRTKLLRSLELHYRRTPWFEALFPQLRPLIEFETDSLLEYNTQAIRGVMKLLRLPTDKLLLASRLPYRGSATERIVTLTAAVGGDAYLSGKVAMETYQDPKQFEAAGLTLIAQNFRHPVYSRGGAFIAGLSTLDALLWCGSEVTASFVADTTP